MSLVSNAMPWTNDEQPQKKRVATMRKTIKSKPYMKEGTDSSPDTYMPSDSATLYKIPTAEDVQSDNDRRNTRVNELINQMSSISEDNDGAKLADFRPPPYAVNNRNIDQDSNESRSDSDSQSQSANMHLPSGSGSANMHLPSAGSANMHLPSAGSANMHLPSAGSANMHLPSGGSANMHLPSAGSANMHLPSGGSANMHLPWKMPTADDEIENPDNPLQRPVPKIQSYTNTKYGNYHNSYDPSQIVYAAAAAASKSQKVPTDDSRLMEKINYMIRLLENQAVEKTANITEEFILYTFLGVFMIFVLDSFARVGKYVR